MISSLGSEMMIKSMYIVVYFAGTIRNFVSVSFEFDVHKLESTLRELLRAKCFGEVKWSIELIIQALLMAGEA